MDKETSYLSEQELDNIIQSVEESGLLKAPDSIQMNVQKQIAAFERSTIIQKRRELFRFGMKIACSTAAAIAFLILIPTQQQIKTPVAEQQILSAESIGFEQSNLILKKIYDKSSDLCTTLNQKANSIFDEAVRRNKQ
ncbi:MAG: hypothetical protein ACK5ML_08150 [Lachnospiraceae bacterium]